MRQFSNKQLGLIAVASMSRITELRKMQDSFNSEGAKAIFQKDIDQNMKLYIRAKKLFTTGVK